MKMSNGDCFCGKPAVKGEVCCKTHAGKEYEENRRSRQIRYDTVQEASLLYHEQYEKAMRTYGGKQCSCPGCDITHPEFLTIDHVHDPRGVRKGRTNRRFFQWLEKNNYPKGFRVFCPNCLFGWRLGRCPHVRVGESMESSVSAS